MFKITTIRFPIDLYEYIRTYAFYHGHSNLSKGLLDILEQFKKENPIEEVQQKTKATSG